MKRKYTFENLSLPIFMFVICGLAFWYVIRYVSVYEVCESNRQKEKMEYISGVCSKIQGDVRDDRVIEYNGDKRVKIYSGEKF